MSAPPYMKLFWADYHQDTRHLTRSEHGAYFLLLGEAWNRGGFLPDDDAILARWALATTEEWTALKPIVMAFFRPAPKGRWRHKRISEELASYSEVSRKRKTAGKKGGSAKPGINKEKPEANASQVLGNSPHNQNQNQNHSTEDKSSASEPAEDLDATAWVSAVGVLTKQGGMTEPDARRFFGKLLAQHKFLAREMLPSVATAMVNATQDPKGYLAKAAAGVARRRTESAAPKRVSFV